MPFSFAPDQVLGFHRDRALLAPLGWASINPNQSSAGEYGYRDGQRKGLRVFHTGSTGPSVEIARSDLGDDTILNNDWANDAAYFIEITTLQMVHLSGDQPMSMDQFGFSNAAHATTGLAGFRTYDFIRRNGFAITKPTTNTNSVIHITLWFADPLKLLPR